MREPIEEHLRCPITGEFFQRPVALFSGNNVITGMNLEESAAQQLREDYQKNPDQKPGVLFVHQGVEITDYKFNPSLLDQVKTYLKGQKAKENKGKENKVTDFFATKSETPPAASAPPLAEIEKPFQIIVVGDHEVGKQSLIDRFVDDKLFEYTNYSRGQAWAKDDRNTSDRRIKHVPIKKTLNINNHDVLFEIQAVARWETHTGKRLDARTFVIVVFDPTYENFPEKIEELLLECNAWCHGNLYMLVSTKDDLVTGDYPKEKLEQILDRFPYAEVKRVSAHDSVDHIFQQAASKVVNYFEKTQTLARNEEGRREREQLEQNRAAERPLGKLKGLFSKK